MVRMGNTTEHSTTKHSTVDVCAGSVAIDLSDTAAALPEVMRLYSTTVRAAARKVLHHSAEVDDVVQETWISFLANGHKINDPRCLGSWLYRVATNAALRLVRKTTRYTLTGDEVFDRVAGDDIDAASAVHADQQRRAVRSAVLGLQAADRELAELLLDPEDLPYKEISLRCGRPMGSLGPTRERLVRKLRSAPPVQRMMDLPTNVYGWRNCDLAVA
jgi:RNA polymerase sigma factor (sigma-70 family)